MAAVLASVLVVLGVLGVAVRFDAPADGARVTDWVPGGVVVAATDRGGDLDTGLRTGDMVGPWVVRRWRAPAGGAPAPGVTLPYEVERAGRTVTIEVPIGRPTVGPMLRYGWGNLVFVVALVLLAVALHLRRPDEPSTAPLLVVAGGLLGGTLVVVAGVAPLVMATRGPAQWLYDLNTIGAYAVAWGALPVFALLLPGDRVVSRRTLVLAGLAAPAATLVVLVAAGVRTEDRMGWSADVSLGTSAVVAVVLLVCGGLGVDAYRRGLTPASRARLRWVAGGAVGPR